MTIAIICILIVAALHIGFLVLEMFLWNSIGPKIFKSLDITLFRPTTALAANQGLYNGFLAAGLIWSSLIRPDQATALFFLGCVIVAGLYGAATVSCTIAHVQALPAAIAALALLLISPLP